MNTQIALFLVSKRLAVSELVKDLLRSRDGDRKSHALDLCRSELDRIDTDNFTAYVDERAAAVTGVDGRIGLDEDHLGAVNCYFSVFSAYVTHCGRLAVTHGVTDGDGHLADLDIVRAAELGNGDRINEFLVEC